MAFLYTESLNLSFSQARKGSKDEETGSSPLVSEDMLSELEEIVNAWLTEKGQESVIIELSKLD